MVEIEGLPERILSKIEPDLETGCWLWTAFRNKGGYGMTSLNGKQGTVHRIIYEAINGPVPWGLVVDHICNNPGCVNPAHLRAITPSENLTRSPKHKGRLFPRVLSVLISKSQDKEIRRFHKEFGGKRGHAIRALLAYALKFMPRDNAKG